MFIIKAGFIINAEKMSIPNLHKIEQPRERLQKYGMGRLSNPQLLAVMLGSGVKGKNVLDLSAGIFRQFKDNRLANASLPELEKVYGLGPAKACEIVACFELGRRLLKDKQVQLLLSPREVWQQLSDIRASKKEHFVVFFLDTQSQLVKREIITIGTLNSSLIHPREIFEPAIKHLASHIIIAHNHPSGSLEPSPEDISVTKRLADIGRLLDMEVMDHVIVTLKGYVSFKEKNLL